MELNATHSITSSAETSSAAAPSAGQLGRVVTLENAVRIFRRATEPLKKVRPRISPRPDLTGARGTSARAAISSYVVTATAAVKLLATAPACRTGEGLDFPRRKTAVPRILPCQRHT